ncbi:DUF3284 domain-containing protein [Lactobacillus sp. PSON]|uniref:DUF3284 domain-containing protein n=1 Tax=Lactobacillus sp. PSON TaxID=3455454 RepID=UPI0040431345
MITISKEFDFTAEDFFDYLDKQLISAIKTARGNNLPVKLTSGTHYTQGDIDTEITNYKRGQLYEAHFKNDRLDIVISYKTININKGVKITFSEEIKSYDPSKYSSFNNWLYNFQLKHGAKKELNKMAKGVYSNMQK